MERDLHGEEKQEQKERRCKLRDTTISVIFLEGV